MGLLRDWNYVEKALEIPALSEMIRETLIRALFVRNDRLLPREIIADLTRTPAVTVRVKDDGEVRKLVNVLNGQESALSLGLRAEDYNYFRTQLGVGKDRVVGVTVRPRTLLTYDWLVPEPGGVQLDFSGYAGIEFDEVAHRAIAQLGAPWKAMYDEALARGHLAPFVPTVPLDFAIGDGIWGDAPFASYEGEFGVYVNALRTISPYGHRTRVGFEEVSNLGTGYDILHAVLPLAAEFFIPVSAALRLAPRPAARKTITYTFDDAGKLSAALDKLARGDASPSWVHLADSFGAQVLRPGTPAEAFTVQVALTGTATGIPLQEKALDSLLAGFKAKAVDVPNPFDVPGDLYRKTAARIEQFPFVGEARIPAASLGDFSGRLKALGQQAAARAGFLASLRATGTVSIFPFFDTTKDRNHLYDLSKGVATILGRIPGGVLTSRLAHLWADDAGYTSRMEILRRLKLTFDTARVIQPLAAPLGLASGR